MRLVNTVLAKDVTLVGGLVDVTVDDGDVWVKIAISDGRDHVLHIVKVTSEDARILAWTFAQTKATVEFDVWESAVKVVTDYDKGGSVLTLFSDGVPFSVTLDDHGEFLMRKALLECAERAEENYKARTEESLRCAREARE